MTRISRFGLRAREMITICMGELYFKITYTFNLILQTVFSINIAVDDQKLKLFTLLLKVCFGTVVRALSALL